MINAEQLHDALSQLPDDLLVPVDALRQKKRFPWKALSTLAACLCLVAGLWLLFPDGVSMDSSNGSAMPPAEGFGGSSLGSICDGITSESTTEGCWEAEVTQVYETYILINKAGSVMSVSFENLEEIPEFSVGQQLRIWCNDGPWDNAHGEWKPYRIEIIEE